MQSTKAILRKPEGNSIKPKNSIRSRADANGDNLHRLAFDHTTHPIILFAAGSGKIIAGNNAACKLLGYSKQQLAGQQRATIFDTEESGFIKMMKKRAAAGMSSALVTGVKKSGKLFPCEITYAVFTDLHGKKNAIATIADMSQSILKQKHIDNIKEKIVAHNINLAKSKQKGIDVQKSKTVHDNILLAKSKQKRIDIKKNKKVAANIVLAKSKQKGIDVQKNKTVADNILLAKSRQKGIDIKKDKKVAANIVLARSKQKGIDVQKNKTVHDNIMLAKSRQRGIDIKKSKTVADNIVLAISKQRTIDIKKDKIVAKNIILAQAKSDGEALISKATFNEIFKLLFHSASDVLFDSDLLSNKAVISEAYEKEYGYKISGNISHREDWNSHIHTEDMKAVMQDYRRMLLSEETEWKTSYRFLRADNSVVNVSSSLIILRNADGKAYRMIGSMHDISKQQVLEERLAEEIELKEKQIAEAARDAKEAERSDIGQELHDNVNQLLGVSKMYLDMAKQGGEKSEIYLARSSQYTLTAIEEIRKITKGLTTDTIKSLGLCEAISNVIQDTMEVNPVKISAEMEDFEEENVNDKFKLNVFRILQEQLNNILKHANATRVVISLLQNKRSIILSIRDNGVGFDTRKKQHGIGIANIKRRATTYNGTADLVSQPGKGCVLTVTFSVKDPMLRIAV